MLFFLSVFLMIVSFSACNKQIEEKDNAAFLQKEREALIKANKYLVKKDAELIEKYLERRNLDLKESGSGLWYKIYRTGKSRKAQLNQVVKLSYTLHLLDGTFCYSGNKDNPKEFLVGKSDVEPGLVEGVLMMNEGDSAKFIIPPHLAYGLIGDQNKIPARATLVYDVKLLSVEEH